jgi:hypothetical protein
MGCDYEIDRSVRKIIYFTFNSFPFTVPYRTVQGCNVLYWGELGNALTASGVRGADLLETYG